MSGLRVAAVLLPTALVAAGGAWAQATHEMAAIVSEADTNPWFFSASAYSYFVPDSENYVLPIVTADRGRLHLEARYNYEDLDTGSAWLGCNFSFGDDLVVDLTPMVGGVFGDITGIAPALELALAWRQLELYSEVEYVYDTSASSESFLYAWSELTWAPVSWFRFGVVAQRTKVYETERDVQRGLLVGFSCGRADFAAYVFNPDDDQPTVVLAVSLSL